MLNFVTHGEPMDKPALLIAHGLFGSARNWGIIAKRLSDSRQVIAVDMRNHGESDWFQSHSYFDQAADLAEVIEHFGAPMDVLGHSMGGKAAMVLALEHPNLINRLVVADIAPVAYGHTQGHLIEAMRSVSSIGFQSRKRADKRLAEVISEPGVRAFLLQSIDIKEERWRLNLDVLDSSMALIIGFPDVTGKFNNPTFFLSGALSDYVKPEHRPEIKRLFPTARFAKIPETGHWIHAEKPREFEASVRAFLDMSFDEN